MLLEDDDGAIVDQIVSNCQRQSSDNIVNQIMKKWVRGGGKQPVTWKTLTDTLKEKSHWTH